jgi:hypothetical protein
MAVDPPIEITMGYVVTQPRVPSGAPWTSSRTPGRGTSSHPSTSSAGRARQLCRWLACHSPIAGKSPWWCASIARGSPPPLNEGRASHAPLCSRSCVGERAPRQTGIVRHAPMHRLPCSWDRCGRARPGRPSRRGSPPPHSGSITRVPEIPRPCSRGPSALRLGIATPEVRMAQPCRWDGAPKGWGGPLLVHGSPVPGAADPTEERAERRSRVQRHRDPSGREARIRWMKWRGVTNGHFGSSGKDRCVRNIGMHAHRVRPAGFVDLRVGPVAGCAGAHGRSGGPVVVDELERPRRATALVVAASIGPASRPSRPATGPGARGCTNRVRVPVGSGHEVQSPSVIVG